MLSAALVACLGLMAAGPLAAQETDEMQPMFVVAHKGFAELMSDLEFIGEVSDNQDLAGGLEGLLTIFTGGQELDWLDKSKPWGLAVSSDGIEFQILAFMPISDIEKFTGMLGAIGASAQKEGDDMWKLDLLGQSLYFRQAGAWTYASISPDFLNNLPEDPSKLHKGVELAHDMVLQVNPQNIPEVFRQIAAAPIKQQVLQALENAPESENQILNIGPEVIERQIDAMVITMNDVSVFNLGASIDRPGRQMLIDVDVQAVPETELAKAYSASGAAPTRFAGFYQPEAAAAANLNMSLTQADTQQWVDLVADIRAQLMEQLEGLGALPDGDAKDTVKEVVGQLLGVLESTASSQSVDAGFALVGEGPFTLIAGASTPKAEDLQKFCEGFAELLENQLGFYGFQIDAAKHKDIRFHSVSVPLPGGDIADQLIELFGFDLELTFGVGADRVFLAMGADGVENLKKAIDASENPGSDLPPVRVQAKLEPLMKILSKTPNLDPAIASAISGIEAGKDQVTVVSTRTEKGMQTKIQGQEGLVKIVGTLMMTMGPGLIPQF
jgi:hypothetical protein